MDIKKNISLIILIIVYVVSIVSAYSLEDFLENTYLKGTSGDLVISAFTGVVFFIIGQHFQKENDKKLNELHRELERELSIRNYDRMISFLKSGRSYNFFLPNYETRNGDWFSYSMRGKLEGDDALAFDMHTHKEFVIYIEDIAYRSIMTPDQLAEYVYGPLKVGNCYFVRFYDNKILLDQDNGKKAIEICWYGSGVSVYSRPSANALYFPQKAEGITLLESFIYNHEGEEADSGRKCEIYQREDNQFYVRLSNEGELKKIIVTYEDGDYLKESPPFLKIEKVEGYFSSISALNNFKNLISEKITSKGLIIPEIEFYNDNLKGQ